MGLPCLDELDGAECVAPPRQFAQPVSATCKQRAALAAQARFAHLHADLTGQVGRGAHHRRAGCLVDEIQEIASED
jgi:hypothetical protein